MNGSNSIAPRRPPAIWVLSLYFAQGLPFFMVNAVAGLMLKALGIGNDEIARWTGLLGLAWVFKPLWSPLLEVAPSKKWLVVGFQAIGAAALAAMALALQLPAFFAAAIAMIASGCMWSTWVKGTKPCSGVSIEAARAFRLKVQCGRKPTMRSSSSTPL